VTDGPRDGEGNRTWDRLRRRKVVQWGLAYAAGAWGLLQGLSYAIATFQWPSTLQPLATLTLLTGLPIALVLAWYHGDKGHQRVTAAELAIITLLFVLGGAMFWRYERGSTDRASSSATAPGDAMPTTVAPAAEASAPPNSIAVLPFVNMSGDPANEYFSDGISEEILNVLAQAPELQVAARTSSFSFKGKPVEIPDIARELRVRMVLEGSVRRQDDKVRITAQLVDAQTGFHVWSETYDRELKDLFAIQDEIARAIGNKMQVQLAGAGPGGAQAHRTINPEAHDHYLRGLALWQRRRDAELWQAVDEFNRAIAIEPGYAEAYGGLALVYTVISDYSARISYEEAAARTTVAAEMAMALDPSLPEPYAALGNLASNESNRPLARALLERAVSLRPSFATAHQWLGTAVATAGDPQTGLASSERASMLDPRSPIVADNHAFVLTALGRYEDAKSVCTLALEFAPDFQQCLLEIGFSEIMLGRPEAARAALVRAAEVGNPSAVPLVNQLVDALEGNGDKAALARRLASLPLHSHVKQGSGNIFEPTYVLSLIMALGEPEVALDYIERNVDERYSILDWGLVRAASDPIRCDPRFQAAAKKLNVTDVRAATLCQPVARPSPGSSRAPRQGVDESASQRPSRAHEWIASGSRCQVRLRRRRARPRAEVGVVA